MTPTKKARPRSEHRRRNTVWWAIGEGALTPESATKRAARAAIVKTIRARLGDGPDCPEADLLDEMGNLTIGERKELLAMAQMFRTSPRRKELAGVAKLYLAAIDCREEALRQCELNVLASLEKKKIEAQS